MNNTTKKLFILASVTASFLGVAEIANAATFTTTAMDTDSIRPNGTGNFTDNRLRALASGSNKIDGFMKFDLSSLPDLASITSMTLTTYHEGLYGSPSNNPEVKIYRVANDSWTRAGNTHLGLNEALTGTLSNFPTAANVSYDWTLDVSAVNWSTDLADNVLSLAMRNEANNSSYIYWHGSSNQYAPTLTIDYTVGSTPIPEPLTILGSGVALGFGALFKRRSSQQQQ